jgi:hypothetical protein
MPPFEKIGISVAPEDQAIQGFANTSSAQEWFDEGESTYLSS